MTGVGQANDAGQCASVAGDRQQVDVIAHQAPAPDLEPEAHRGLAELVEVSASVRVRQENLAATVATVGDVVRNARDGDAR